MESIRVANAQTGSFETKKKRKKTERIYRKVEKGDRKLVQDEVARSVYLSLGLIKRTGRKEMNNFHKWLTQWCIVYSITKHVDSISLRPSSVHLLWY